MYLEDGVSLKPGWARGGRLFDMVVEDWPLGGRKVRKGLAQTGVQLRTRVPRMMLKTSYSSSSRLNRQPTFSTAIDVSPALLLAIISTAEPVLAVTARHHASQSEDTKPSVLHSSTTGDNISQDSFEAMALTLNEDG